MAAIRPHRPYESKKKSKDELLKMLNKEQLKQLCTENFVEVSGKKQELIDRLVQCPSLNASQIQQKVDVDIERKNQQKVKSVLLEELSKSELRQLCQQNCLRVSGNKAELLEELIQCDAELLEELQITRIRNIDSNREAKATLNVQSSSNDNQLDPHSSVFKGKVFALSGGLSMTHREMEALIIHNGGNVVSTPNAETDYVVVKNREVDVNNNKAQQAMNVLKIPFVVEGFVYDSIEVKLMMDVDGYRHGPKKRKKKTTSTTKKSASRKRKMKHEGDEAGTNTLQQTAVFNARGCNKETNTRARRADLKTDGHGDLQDDDEKKAAASPPPRAQDAASTTSEWLSCGVCDKVFTSGRAREVHIVQTRDEAHDSIFRGGTKQRNSLSWPQKLALIERQNKKCALCMEELDLTTVEIDHIVALCDGGSNHWFNFQALDPNCHVKKTKDRYLYRR
mmetsp:Transcript_34464/g.55293  ORF Transcript_34464/g.55293 Transcript_34464/m.55293 type:complete len:451 (+) Transcript_34464:129-1481(+)